LDNLVSLLVSMLPAIVLNAIYGWMGIDDLESVCMLAIVDMSIVCAGCPLILAAVKERSFFMIANLRKRWRTLARINMII
jgi:hypothetical protein